MLLHETKRGLCEPLLFMQIDAGCRAFTGRLRGRANLHKYNTISVYGNDVEFASSVPMIDRHHLITQPTEMPGCKALRAHAEPAAPPGNSWTSLGICHRRPIEEYQAYVLIVVSRQSRKGSPP